MDKRKPYVGILRNSNQNSGDDWVRACIEIGVDYQLIDLTASDWIENVLGSEFTFFVFQPEGLIERLKTQFDERLYIINKVLKIDIYPSYEECVLYENKKLLSYFLQARDIPHPTTWVFYDYKEAKQFIEKASYPIVAKTSIGAAGTGVKIINNVGEALSYIRKAFRGKGINRRFGPNPNLGNPQSWLIKAVKHPDYFLKKVKMYWNIQMDAQRGYTIFQEYIPHDFEWRLVKIDESYFAHKKIKVGEKASGGKKKEFGLPPTELMEFFDNVCKDNHFTSVDIDVFEGKDGYLVNEIQCVFGIPYRYLMKVNEKIGRLQKIDERWVFEEGDFTVNSCCNLRLKKALELFHPDFLTNSHE